MNHHHIFQIWIIFLIFIVCSLFTLIPYEKYQTEYMNFIHDFNSVPQRHYDEQIEKAELYTDENDEEDETIEESKIKANFRKEETRVNDYREPYFIRDSKTLIKK